MDIPGNLGASSVPPVPARETAATGHDNNTGGGFELNKLMVPTAPRQQPLPALPASIQASAIGGFPVANRKFIFRKLLTFSNSGRLS